MGKLQSATPAMAFGLGFMLLGFFPSDRSPSALTSALAVVALGRRGAQVLPRVRDWMNTNSWIVSEVVLAFFVVIVLTG